MSEFSLPMINSVLQFVGNALKRVIFNDTNERCLYTIMLNVTTTNIETYKYDQISDLMNSELVILSDDPNTILSDNEELSKAQNRILNKAYSITKQIFSDGLYPRLNGRNRELFKEIADKNQISVKTVYKYFRLYLQGGMVKSALIPNFVRCGSQGKCKNPKVKMGRKYTNPDFIGIILTEKDKEKMDYVIKHYLNKQQNASVRNGYEYLLNNYYCDIVTNYRGIKEKITKGLNEIPSYDQFSKYYYKDKNKNKRAKLISQLGQDKFNNNYKYLPSDEIFASRYAGNIYEIDATIGNFYLVSEFRPDLVIGRPVVYFLVDCFTGMITGFQASITAPSWDNAATAIYNALERKVNFCKKYNIDIEDEEWPSFGCPNIILCDNGEVSKTLSDDVCSKLNIEIANARRYRGSDKGGVEHAFALLNNHLAGKGIPGELKKLTHERGDADYRKTANINIKEFTTIIINFILFRNKRKFRELTDENMIKAGIANSPISIWKYSLENIGGTLRTYPSDYVIKALMRKGNARITNEGIKFHKLLYDCLDIDHEKLGFDSKLNGQKSCKVFYDRRDDRIIYLYLNKDILLSARLNIKKSKNNVYQNKSWDEVEFYYYYKKIQKPYITEDNNSLASKFDDSINSTVAKAKKRKIGKKTIKNTKANRQEDIKIYNTINAFKLNNEDDSSDIQISSENVINPYDELSSYDILLRICIDQEAEDE